MRLPARADLGGHPKEGHLLAVDAQHDGGCGREVMDQEAESAPLLPGRQQVHGVVAEIAKHHRAPEEMRICTGIVKSVQFRASAWSSLSCWSQSPLEAGPGSNHGWSHMKDMPKKKVTAGCAVAPAESCIEWQWCPRILE